MVPASSEVQLGLQGPYRFFLIRQPLIRSSIHCVMAYQTSFVALIVFVLLLILVTVSVQEVDACLVDFLGVYLPSISLIHLQSQYTTSSIYSLDDWLYME
jgi:uncharacterized Tic20 family protein